MYDLYVSSKIAQQRHAEAIADAQDQRLARDAQVEPRQSAHWLARTRRVLFAPSPRPSLDPAA